MKRRTTKKKAKARKARAGKGPKRHASAARRTAARRTAARHAPAKKKASRRRAGRKQEPTLVAEAAIARATAAAQASVRAELRSKTQVAERLTAAAISEAEEVSLLLEDESGDDDEEPGSPSEEDQYFLKTPLGPPRPRVRPAPGIESPRMPEVPPVVARKAKAGRKPAGRSAPAGRPVAAPAATAKPAAAVTGSAKRGAGAPGAAKGAASPLPAAAAHLFPRNLKLAYPVAARAEGVFIEDTEGRRYLDACSGAVVCSIGHGVKEVAEVMTAQARRLAFAHPSQFISRETMELSARIAALAPGDMKQTGRVYLVSGGSEAVETAIKLARQFHVESGRPSKHKVITRWQSYHGSTLGALAATGNVARRAIYTPLIASTPHIAPCYCYRCPFELKYPACDLACADDLESTIRQEGPDTVAAFMAEPVVGATLGAVPAVDGYWPRLRALCDKYDILLIADEVMTGVGRTGKNFGIDHFKVVPDLIVTGKGLSAGYTPLGAVIARGFVADAIASGRGFFEHGFTYSANPLSAAIGNAVLAYIERHGLIARAAKFGKFLGERLQSLRRLKFVGDVRGMGMMWGVEIVKDRASREPYPAALKVSRRIYDACMAEGLLIYPGSGTREGQDGDHFIVAPPFTIDRGEIEEIVTRLDAALRKVSAGLR